MPFYTVYSWGEHCAIKGPHLKQLQPRQKTNQLWLMEGRSR